MGSAPASGSFENRLASSARRGAYVGQGMTGVYRVTRSRTTQAQSLRRARANPNAWIQPEDMEVSTTGWRVGGISHESYFDDADVIRNYDPANIYTTAPDNYPLA